MCNILKQYSEKIKGTFSFFDRLIINGYINPLMNEHSRVGALYQLGILYKDYKNYFSAVTDSIKERIEHSAEELGCPIIYLHPQKKEKRILPKDT